MDKMKMIQEIARRIQEDESLAVSEWQGTLIFEDGDPISSELINLNEIEGMPKPPAGEKTAIEIFIQSIAKCYSTTLFKNAFHQNFSLDQIKLQVTGKFDQRPFLGLAEGNPGILEPTIDLYIDAKGDEEKIEEIAKLSLDQSPVIRSLHTPVTLSLHKYT